MDSRRPREVLPWVGAGIPLGAGLGLLVALVFADPGRILALMIIGASIGLLVGAVAQGRDRRHRTHRRRS